MSKYLPAFIYIFFAIANSNAQSYLPAKPHVINFSALSAYQLQHPVKNKQQQIVEQGEDRDKNYKFKPKATAQKEVKCNVMLPKVTSRSVSPPPDISFNGTLDDDYLIPPDINGVIGDSLIMETNNQEFDIFDRQGFLLQAVYLSTFFGSLSPYFFFDPHVIYDSKDKRYIVCADGQVANGNGGVFVGISQTSDPTGNWNLYDAQAVGNTADFLDFPMVGFNKNWVVITANEFIAPNFDSAFAEIFIFNKDSIYNDSTVTVRVFSDSNIYSLSPAATADTLLNTEYLVADWNGDSTNNYGYVKLCTITGTPDSPVYTPMQLIGVNYPWSENPVHAAQLGNSNPFETVDTRIDFAKYINGSLWFSHTVYLPADSPTYSAVDWWQVDPLTPTIQQFGRVGDTTGQTFYFFPSINVNSNNDALLGYSTSSYTTYASSGYVYRSANDASNTMEGGYIYKEGLDPYYKTYGGGRNRWGDFSGTAVDPTNNSFWTFQEYANTPANNWGTVIANVSSPTCNGSPVSGIISAAKDTICNGARAILQLTGNTIAENGIQIQWQQSPNGTTGWINDTSSILTVASQLVSGPLNQTTYFRCLVTCTNSKQTATSAIVPVYVYGLSSVSNGTVCAPGTFNIVANIIGGDVKWFKSDTSLTPLSLTNTLQASITKDTTFYITVGDTTSYSAGITDSTAGTGGIYSLFDKGMEFTALNDFIIDSVFVYAYNAGTVKVNLVDNATSIVLQTDSFLIPESAVLQKTMLPLNMSVEGGYDYKLNATGTTDSGLFRTNSSVSYPYVVPGIISINQSIDLLGSYYFFYDWHISSTCKLTRIPVPVKIDTVVVTISAPDDSLCIGDSVALSAHGALLYNWMPGNITGSTITVSPLDTTTYTVTGTDAHECSGSAFFKVYVKKCTSGIELISNSVSIKIYPNPSSDIINFIIEGAIPGNSNLEIDNVLGQRILLNQVNNGAIQSINISSFASGVYFYKLESGNEQMAEGKFVKE